MKIKTIARVGDRNQEEKIEKLASINHSMCLHLSSKKKENTMKNQMRRWQHIFPHREAPHVLPPRNCSLFK